MSGVGGSGGAKGGWRVLGVEGETLRKELGMGEGAVGGGALIRRLPSALGRTLGLGRPSLRVEAVEDFFFTAILDWCFLGEEGPRTSVLEVVVVLGGCGALVALAAPNEIFLYVMLGTGGGGNERAGERKGLRRKGGGGWAKEWKLGFGVLWRRKRVWVG